MKIPNVQNPEELKAAAGDGLRLLRLIRWERVPEPILGELAVTHALRILRCVFGRDNVESLKAADAYIREHELEIDELLANPPEDGEAVP